MIVLFDGWAFVHQPNSPGAVHLWSLLENLSANCQAILAIPAPLSNKPPGDIETKLIHAPDTPSSRLRWEQRRLPALAKQLGVDLIHLTSSTTPLFGNIPTVLSPAGIDLSDTFLGQFSKPRLPTRPGGIAARIRQALLPAGILRTRGIIWPGDLPKPDFEAAACYLNPIVPSAFSHSNSPELLDAKIPEDYVLVHGPGSENDFRRILDAWSWAAPAIGEYYPLLVAGFDSTGYDQYAKLVAEYHLNEYVKFLPEVSINELAVVYHRCSAFLYTRPISPWGDPLCLAMACAKPIVAPYSNLADARLGPAAYLVQSGELLKVTSRAIGAALVSVVVEESVAVGLSDEAKKRSAAWLTAEQSFQDALGEFYAQLINP